MEPKRPKVALDGLTTACHPEVIHNPVGVQLSQNNVTVQDLADMFARADSGEGWMFAAIVACAVKKGAGQGSKDLVSIETRLEGNEKVSATKFAEFAGISTTRVLRLLAAWNMAASEEYELCSDSTNYGPNDFALLAWPSDTMWETVYRASNAKLTAEGLGDVEDSISVLRAQQEAAEAVQREQARINAEAMAAEVKKAKEALAEQERMAKVANDNHEEARLRQEALTRQQRFVDAAEAAQKAERMAAQVAEVAARNATAKAEAIAKEEARRAHRAAEESKANALLIAAAKARKDMLAEQEAARLATEKAAKAAAAAARKQVEAEALAAHDALVQQMLASMHAVSVNDTPLSHADWVSFQALVAQITKVQQSVRVS